MKIMKRILVSIVFALLAGGITLIVAQAQTPEPTQPTAPAVIMTDDNCIACHNDIAKTWMTGPHGLAGSDPVFIDSWNAQGKPGACLVCHTTGYDPSTGLSEANNVACTACHTPVPVDHPTQRMPIDTTPDLCGKCHSDPRFAVDNWKLSAHYQRNMTCSVCHDPHTAGMKTVEGDVSVTTDASALCANCHKDAMQNFPTSKHAEAGVTCVNCHLGFNVGNLTQNTTDFVNAHKAPDHSFIPTLDTCNTCHADQMHAPGQAVAAAAILIEESGGTPTPNPTPVATPVPPVSNQPGPVSPLGFAGLAGLLGLAGGVVLSPWLEKLYNRMNKDGRKK